jgi:hypothetical protein
MGLPPDQHSCSMVTSTHGPDRTSFGAMPPHRFTLALALFQLSCADGPPRAVEPDAPGACKVASHCVDIDGDAVHIVTVRSFSLEAS